MNLIAAVDKNWAIGKEGGLLATIRDDMEFFRNMTTGNVIVMGRKTLDSFPGGRPLPDRVNIVLTSNRNFERAGVVVCHTLDEVKKEIAKYDSERVFCVGGGSVYKLMLDMCDTAYITKIDYAYDADTYFPNLDELDGWDVIQTSEEHTSFDIAYRFMTYKKQ